MEEETIEEEIKFKSNQLQIKKNGSTGLIDAWASVHPKLSGRTDDPMSAQFLRANWNQVKILYVTG